MQKAGFIGLGIMGKPMAANLLKNGVALAAFTRSGVPDELTQAGAVACDSPAAVAAHADVIFVMVPDTPDVERVLFGEQGLADALRPGQIVVDRSFGAGIGARVTVFSRPLRVSGTIGGTASIANFVAFANFEQLAAILGARGVVNYVLVRARPGVSPARLAARIDGLLPSVTASTRPAFAASERRIERHCSMAFCALAPSSARPATNGAWPPFATTWVSPAPAAARWRTPRSTTAPR